MLVRCRNESGGVWLWRERGARGIRTGCRPVVPEQTEFLPDVLTGAELRSFSSPLTSVRGTASPPSRAAAGALPASNLRH